MDAWSCGVVLYVLLLGNTPWDEPTSYSPEYQIYRAGPKTVLKYDPWTRLDPDVLCIARFRDGANWSSDFRAYERGCQEANDA